MKWFMRIALVLGALIAVLAVLPFFISLNDYIPQIEQAVSVRLGEPVKISNLRAIILPQPVDGITAGKTGDIKVGKVTVTAGLLPALRPAPLFSVRVWERRWASRSVVGPKACLAEKTKRNSAPG
jgi:uncharacterized protein involved in outer membrane biogenesis